MPENFRFPTLVVARALGIAGIFVLFKLLPRERNLGIGLLLSVIAHILFLQCFTGYSMFHIRYLETAVVLSRLD